MAVSVEGHCHFDATLWPGKAHRFRSILQPLVGNQVYKYLIIHLLPDKTGVIFLTLAQCFIIKLKKTQPNLTIDYLFGTTFMRFAIVEILLVISSQIDVRVALNHLSYSVNKTNTFWFFSYRKSLSSTGNLSPAGILQTIVTMLNAIPTIKVKTFFMFNGVE